MKKSKVVIIDDEQDAIIAISLIIKEFCTDIEVVGFANMVDQAWDLIKQQEPDFVILDIDMPRGTGFDLLERFPIRKFDVIFVSAYHKFEQKSKAYGAFAYLTKPIDIELFVSTASALIKQRNEKTNHYFRLIL